MGEYSNDKIKKAKPQSNQSSFHKSSRMPVQRQVNTTGLPDDLKMGIENLSGYSMDDVRVHYNSNQPAQLQAHAFARGSDIHLGRGQEKHLPHEAWHVVQQKQGRVKPTMQMRSRVAINDDDHLEREADQMGMTAMKYSGESVQRITQRAVHLNVAQLLSDNDKNQLRNLNFENRTPSDEEVTALDAFDSYADITNLTQLNLVNTWADLVRIAGFTRSAAEVITLVDLDVGLTLDTIETLDRFTMEQLQNLAQFDQVTSWDDIIRLGGLTRSYDEIAGFLGNGDISIDLVAAVDHFTMENIQGLENVGLIGSLNDWMTLGGLTRSYNDIIALAGNLLDGDVITADQLNDIENLSNDQVGTLRNLNQVTIWGDIVDLAGSARSMNDLVTLAGITFDNNEPTVEQMMAVEPFTLQIIQNMHNDMTWDEVKELGDVSTGANGNIADMLKNVVSAFAGKLNDDLQGLTDAVGLNVDVFEYAAVLVDLNSANIDTAFDSAAWNDTLGEAVPLIINYLENAVSFNACFDGANRLVGLLGSENNNVTYQSGGGSRDEYPLNQQGQRANVLIGHINQASQGGIPTIFRIHLAGHGFTLTVNNQNIYQLETLAGSERSGTLLQSMLNGRRYNFNTIANVLRGITSNSVQTRSNAANVMNWNAGPIDVIVKSNPPHGDYDTLKDPMTVYWTASNLLARNEIINTFANKIMENRRNILDSIANDNENFNNE